LNVHCDGTQAPDARPQDEDNIKQDKSIDVYDRFDADGNKKEEEGWGGREGPSSSIFSLRWGFSLARARLLQRRGLARNAP